MSNLLLSFIEESDKNSKRFILLKNLSMEEVKLDLWFQRYNTSVQLKQWTTEGIEHYHPLFLSKSVFLMNNHFALPHHIIYV